MELYRNVSFNCSKIITKSYSTSFSLGIRTLDKKFRDAIYGIYGFVRYADEIVDTFHDYDKEELLKDFKKETYKAIKQGIHMNPVLHAYQEVVNTYGIDNHLTEAFFKSMEMDLFQRYWDRAQFDEYVYGSAEVVGLMCLRVFTEGDEKVFESLRAPARSLGAAFQKINFLRDVQADFEERGRVYFPGVDFSMFTEDAKKKIEAEIKQDFDDAYKGIVRLPEGARAGVYLAYVYYLNLFKKIRRVPATRILKERIRVPDQTKLALLVGTYFRHKFNYI